MDYTIEEIYCLVGKDDKTAGLTFKYNSDAYNLYGRDITVVFVYTQPEREEMDMLVQTKLFSKDGKIRARYLGTELSQDKVDKLLNEGIYSGDIEEICYLNIPEINTYHSKEKRYLKKNIIPFETLPDGGDYNWMYGFVKKLNDEGIGQCPSDRKFYLAAKLFFEPENLTVAEKKEIFTNGIIDENVESNLLQIKYNRKEISFDEMKRGVELYNKKKEESVSVLDKYLKEAGSSFKKLCTENIDQATDLFMKVMHFRERNFNVSSKYPIYIDLDSYLHIYMRHVEEFKVNKHFEHRDKFQWDENDVFSVINHVVECINDEYQEYRKEKPDQRYSRFGEQSMYFEGDYYTIHIEPNGRISTLYKNKKNI